MRAFRDLSSEEQQTLRAYGRQRYLDGYTYADIVRELAAQDVSISPTSVGRWCDDKLRVQHNKTRLEQRKQRYTEDAEYRKRQHKRQADRRKVRRATDPDYCERTYRKNNERRRAKAAAARSLSE